MTVHSNRDLGATIASGSHGCSGMAIVPCSMKTLAAVAHGLSRSLVERAADVMLKEQRRLEIVPRETPMSLPQLKNMVLCAEAGAMILPAMPAFYQLPKTLDDLADFMAGKILSALGLERTNSIRRGRVRRVEVNGGYGGNGFTQRSGRTEKCNGEWRATVGRRSRPDTRLKECRPRKQTPGLTFAWPAFFSPRDPHAGPSRAAAFSLRSSSVAPFLRVIPLPP